MRTICRRVTSKAVSSSSASRRMVRERGLHQVGSDALESRSLLRQDALDSVGDVGIRIGEVADDLEDAPLSRDRPRDQLLAAQTVDGRAEVPGTSEVRFDNGHDSSRSLFDRRVRGRL